MATYTATFARTELKYRINAAQLAALCEELAHNMQPDLYGKTLISSMYFDTPGRDLIGRSVEHPLYKEKARLRRYGEHIRLDSEPCFVELKKKYRGIVYKRRTQMSANAASLLMSGRRFREASLLFPLQEGESELADTSARDRQIALELEAFVRRSGALAPSMLIECERTAWQLPHDSPFAASELRITIDERLGFRDLMDLSGQDIASDCKPLIGNNEAILEIKATGAMPRWLVDTLNREQIRPASFTKYGSAYERVTRRP